MAGLSDLDDAQLVDRFNGLTLARLSSSGLNDGKGIELFFEDASSSFNTNGQGTPTSTALADAAANPGGLLLDVSSPKAASEVNLSSSPDDTDRLQDTGGPNEGSGADTSAKAQICFDFTKGMCTRGDKCKFSHDIATIVHFNSKEKGICFDYLRNQCHRGLLCRFSHDLSNIAQQCQVYNGGAAAPRPNRTTSICYDFVKGVCSRGSECRYSHDLSLIARTARSSSSGGGSATEVCYDFLRGRCSRAANCKYSHSVALLGSGILTTLQPGSLGAMGSSGMSLGMDGMMQGHGPMHALSAPVTPRVSSSGIGGGLPQQQMGHMGAHMGHVGGVGAHGLMMGGFSAGAVAGSAPSNGYGMLGGSGMAEALTAAATDRLAMIAAMQQQQQCMSAPNPTAGMDYAQSGSGSLGAAVRGTMQAPPPPPPTQQQVAGRQGMAGEQQLAGYSHMAGHMGGHMSASGSLHGQAGVGGQAVPVGQQVELVPAQQSVGLSQLTNMLAAHASRRVSDDSSNYRDQPHNLIAAANGGIHAMHSRTSGPSPLPPALPSTLPPTGPGAMPPAGPGATSTKGGSLPPTPNGRQLYVRTTPTPTPGQCAAELPSPHGMGPYAHSTTPGSYSQQAFSPQGYSPASFAGPQGFSPQGYSPGPFSAPAHYGHMMQQQQWPYQNAQQQQQQQQYQQQQQNSAHLVRTSSAPQPNGLAQAQNAQAALSYPGKQQQQQQQQQQQPQQASMYITQHAQQQAPPLALQAAAPGDLPPPSPHSFRQSMAPPPRLSVVNEAGDVPCSSASRYDKPPTAPQPIPGRGSSSRVPDAAGVGAAGCGMASPPCASNRSENEAVGDGFLGLGDSVDSNNGNGCLSPNLLPLLKEIWNR